MQSRDDEHLKERRADKIQAARATNAAQTKRARLSSWARARTKMAANHEAARRTGVSRLSSRCISGDPSKRARFQRSRCWHTMQNYLQLTGSRVFNLSRVSRSETQQSLRVRVSRRALWNIQRLNVTLNVHHWSPCKRTFRRLRTQ